MTRTANSQERREELETDSVYFYEKQGSEIGRCSREDTHKGRVSVSKSYEVGVSWKVLALDSWLI